MTCQEWTKSIEIIQRCDIDKTYKRCSKNPLNQVGRGNLPSEFLREAELGVQDWTPSMRHGMRILLLAVALARNVAEFTLGALTAASIYPDGLAAIIAAHFDFRKHFEPDLRARRWKAPEKGPQQ